MTHRRLLLLALLVEIAAARTHADAAYVPGRLVLKLTADLASKTQAGLGQARGGIPATGSPALDHLLRRHGGRAIRAPFAGRQARAASLAARFPRRTARARPGARSELDRIFVVDLAPDLDIAAAAREYARVPGVVWAEPDPIRETVLVPNDPYFASSGAWGQPFRDLWGLVTIDAPSAWNVTRGAGVIVAISDTGVDAAHPDIAARMWTNPGEIPGNGIDDDGNGFVDDVHGWDFLNADNDPFDDNGHGTHVAGTVAAAGNNGLGVVGVAWEASIMAVKGLSAGGSGGNDALAEGIMYAVDNGADVINASWGGYGDSQLLTETVAAAHDAGVVFVAAAGNAASDVAGFFPADIHQAIAVAASNHVDELASFSNFGMKIDVAAPGGGDTVPAGNSPTSSILSLRSSGARFDSSVTVGTQYARLAGTSMASPHVAGAAALVLAAHPGYTPEQVRQALRVSADDIATPGFDVHSGYGRLNVGRAVLVTDVPVVEITAPTSGTKQSGVVTITGSAGGTGFADYTLEYGNEPFWTTIVGPVATPVEDGVLGTLDMTTFADRSYTIRLRVRNTSNVTFVDRVNIVLDHVDITSPLRDDVVAAGGAPIEVRGTAGGGTFESYRVEYRVIEPDLTVGPWTSAGVTLPGGGTSPVTDGLLATIDPAALPGPRDIDIRLRVDIGLYDVFEFARHVTADPTLRAGWPRRVATPFSPDVSPSVTLADLDGDGGKEILLVAEGQLIVLRADGTDMPGWPRTAPVGARFLPEAPSVADLDGDGTLEIVTPTTSGADVRHPDGSLVRTITPGGYAPEGPIALADVDGDGQRELVYAAHRTVRIVRADGTPVHTISGGCGNPLLPCVDTGVAVGDLDGDGRLEIAFAREDLRERQYLAVYNADGAPRAPFPRKISRHQRIVDNLPIMADVDGDGVLDVALNSDSLYVTAYTGRGKRRRFPKGDKLPEFVLKGSPTFRSGQEPISAGDLDGDGRPELVVAQSFPAPYVKRGEPPVVLGQPYSGEDYLVALAPALAPLPSLWSRTFGYPQALKRYGPGTAAIGDVDGDGQQDTVIGSGTCAFWDAFNDIDLRRCYTVYAIRRDGSLLPGFPKPTPDGGKSKLATPALGDLDGDGLKEIVWIDDANDVLVWTVPGTPGPENMQWPMYRHDAAHTGALSASP